jgi:hypothetical protein
MKLRMIVDLLPEIGRGVQDHPIHAVSANRDRRLSQRRSINVTAPRSAGSLIVAVPLRESATSRRSQYKHVKQGAPNGQEGEPEAGPPFIGSADQISAQA